MSTAALHWAMTRNVPDAMCKLVLIYLGDYYNIGFGCAWPSMATLAERTGADERTVRRAISRLIEMKLVTKEERPGRTCRLFLHTKPDGSKDEVLPQYDKVFPAKSAKPGQNDRGGKNEGGDPGQNDRDPGQSDPHPGQSDPRTKKELPNNSKSAVALAPEGARPLRTTLEAWQKRLDGYNPSDIRGTWKAFWGARPDAIGDGHLMPPELLAAWCAKQKAASKERGT